MKLKVTICYLFCCLFGAFGNLGIGILASAWALKISIFLEVFLEMFRAAIPQRA